MADFPLWAAIQTVKAGISARAGLREYREAGGTVNDARWFRMVSSVRTAVAAGNDEPIKPLDARPRGDEITVMPTKTASGYLQNVTVYVRDRVTGIVRARPFSVPSDFLATRADVIDTALANFQHNSEEYEETVLGAVYRSTHVMVPESES